MRKIPTTKEFEQLTSWDKARVLDMVKQGANRRQVLSWMTAAGATAAFAGGVFTGATTVLAETPKRGGRLMMAVDTHGPDDTLDPAAVKATVDYFRMRMFYGSLVRLKDDLSWEPELAEEVLSNDNASVWTFKLRKDIEFHNGKTMTADDVVYSMNRHIGPDTASTGGAAVNMIELWEKVNEHEVRAVLKSPNADLPVALGTFHFKIIPDGHTDFTENVVGTGPFKVKEFRPGIRTIGTRFENFWGDGPYVDEIEHFGIADPVARVNAFLNGDVDAMVNVPPKSVAAIEAAPGKGIWSIESGAYITICARLDMQPSGNRDLLLAMQHLMDRQRIVKGVLKGQGSVGNDQPIGKAYFDHCPDIPQRELDPDKAKFHFEKSGVGNTEIPISAAEVGPGTVDQVLVLQREAQKIGMNVKVRKVTTDGYWSSVWMKDPFCVVRWNMRPTANIMLSLAYRSDAKWNETFWSNKRFDDILTEALAVTDAAKRKELYCEAQMLIHEAGGSIIPAHINYVDGAADFIKGRTYVPLNNFGGAESPEYLWRDDV